MLQAMQQNDPDFDGVFFTAVKTTGVFCLPSCSARTPNAANVDFYGTSRDALAAGFRPCKRCKPLHNGTADPDWLPRLMKAVDDDPSRRWHDYDISSDALGLGIDVQRVYRMS